MRITLRRGVWPAKTQRLFLAAGPGQAALPDPGAAADSLDDLRAGDALRLGDRDILRVLGRNWRYTPVAGAEVCELEALDDMAGSAPSLELEHRRQGWALAWVVLSDRAAAGEREDACGSLIAQMAREALSLRHAQGFVIPDEPSRLKALLLHLACEDGFDLVLTSGGTGLAPRDATPEATCAVLERRVPGLERAMTNAGLAATPMAGLSRAVAGTIGRTLVVNLPGSPKAVRESLQAVLPAVAHGLDKLAGDPSECGEVA
jgi:molybdenum cofactor synthesis domain-containing protein